MKPPLFSYQNYQLYLRDFFRQEVPQKPKRADLARRLNCQSSFISQVFNSKAHFSLEHAILVTEFLDLDPDERRYFMLLLQLAKAGSAELKAFLQEELNKIRQQAEVIKINLQVKGELSDDDQTIYYSHWWYSAIHILVAFPTVQSVDDLRRCLKLPKSTIAEALQFLLERGLVNKKEGKLEIGKTRIHLGSKSRNITRHHMNWREKMIEVLAARNPDNLHFTGVIGISKAGADALRMQIMNLLKKAEETVEKTKEEAAYVFLLDFFELGPG